MIESSFCFLPGVGRRTERRWWQRGIGTWEDFLSASHSIPGIGPSRKALYDAALDQAKVHRAQEDSRYFATTLHTRDQWRLYEWLRPRAVYLDIETNSFGQITIVGLYGQGSFTSLVEGELLSRRRLCDELAQYDLLVTFNGTSFDLPVLLASIQGVPLDQPHIDLCLLSRQLGYRGGLKAIELQLGIHRRADLWGLSGADAGQLWNRWRHSRDEEARERLLAYNEADCVNLQPMADLFYCQMVQQHRSELGESR
ncbi:MAG TPA: ribonuclease H-like domain-containing protein [Nitrospiraceae bacterium]|nr:ribonuclease H-like domain-containing protein [Nitrospiraceae bacterium]